MDRIQNINLNNLEIYKQIVEHMTESLWILDKQNKTIYVNSNFCEISGYSYEEIIGKDFSFLIDDKKNCKTNNCEFIIKSKSGEKIPVLFNSKEIKNGGQVITLNDLRELKSLKKVEKDLRKLNKTKDEFISIVGHELRTPLTSIRGYLSMILDGDMGEINPEISKALSHSYNSSVRLIKLVNDILSISKIESGKMKYNIKEFKIKDLIESIYKDIYLNMNGKKIDFKIDISENLKKLIIKQDKDKLKQVLLNLLTNALKFTKNGKKITLKISEITNKIRFEVIDQGIGIDKNKKDILFEKFSQVESTMQRHNTSGLGLGLAISKKIINQFNSEIYIESELGKGSKFYFDLDLNI